MTLRGSTRFQEIDDIDCSRLCFKQEVEGWALSDVEKSRCLPCDTIDDTSTTLPKTIGVILGFAVLVTVTRFIFHNRRFSIIRDDFISSQDKSESRARSRSRSRSEIRSSSNYPSPRGFGSPVDGLYKLMKEDKRGNSKNKSRSDRNGEKNYHGSGRKRSNSTQSKSSRNSRNRARPEERGRSRSKQDQHQSKPISGKMSKPRSKSRSKPQSKGRRSSNPPPSGERQEMLV